MPTPPQTKSTHLLNLTTSFITSFIANTPPTQILNTYFTPTASITEHGPLWARSRLPFLATTFTGRRTADNREAGTEDTLDDYYDLLARTLRFLPQEDTLPAEGEYVVDEGKGRVVVVLRGRFESVGTGRGWEERFVYVLGMREVEGEEGMGMGRWRIERLELWADPLSAWVACGDGNGDGREG